MFNTLYLLHYNNYYNRMVKQEETINDYMDYVVAALNATNFNPNDNINTEHVVNIADGLDPDYAIVIDSEGNIVSRWFVIDATRVRGGQWKIALHRDVIVDYYNIIVKAPCFIEKATLSSDNPLIFNKEDFTANRIKTSETLLKDKSNCAWLVGYLSTDSSIEDVAVVKSQDTDAENIGELANWEWYPYCNKATNPAKYKNNFSKLTIEIPFGKKVGDYTTHWVEYNYLTQQLSYSTSYRKVVEEGTIVPGSGQTLEEVIKEFFLAFIPQFNFNYVQPELLPDYIGDITELQGKVIKDADDKFYSVNVNSVGSTQITATPLTANGQIDILIKNIAQEVTGRNPKQLYVIMRKGYSKYKITLAEQFQYSETFNLDIAKNYTNDIYRMICIPYPDEGETFRVTGATNDKGEELDPILITRENALAIANAIIKKGGGIGTSSTLVYDFQLLPYCPIGNSVLWDVYENEYFISLQGDTPEQGHYTTVGTIGVIFEVKDSLFSFNIQHSIEVKDVKVENQLDTYRLCSPNYAAMFEFSAAKNGGVDYFNVDCYYKPYQPYIHINPNFKLLYGEDFNDPRGLILAGDFSLSSKNDAFTTYELTNKNYQLIFDRQIKNLEIQNKYQRVSDIFAAFAGTAQTAAGGATIGAVLGGGVGMGIGAAAGTTLSAGAGVADILINEKLRNEAMDLTKDLYSYNLANIQAQPDALTKVTAINNNNKIYPVLEFYTCTEKEREAFKQKLKYNGMSVGIIDKISNYIQLEPSYIKGQIIRLENLNDDFHVANTIAGEVNKGLFI